MNARMPLPKIEDASPIIGDRAHSETAGALVARLNAAGRRSTAEMLQELRRVFPDSPLAVRVRALEALRRR